MYRKARPAAQPPKTGQCAIFGKQGKRTKTGIIAIAVFLPVAAAVAFGVIATTATFLHFWCCFARVKRLTLQRQAMGLTLNETPSTGN